MNYTLYIHINKINGKVYIGITCKDVEKRWGKGNGYYRNNHFYNSIRKYGWDNFEHMIIARGLSEDEARWIEIELIKVFDSTNPNKGYNVTLGGGGTKGLSTSGKNNGMYGKHHSEETKLKISESHKNKYHSEETKKKIGNSVRGINNPRARCIICITTGEVFYTIKDGGIKYNVEKANINSCCKGRLNSAGKLNNTKLKWMYLDDFLKKCKCISL